MKHSDGFKLIAVRRYLKGGITFRELSADLEVSRSALQRWVAWHRAHGSFAAAVADEPHSAEFKLTALNHMWDNRLSYAKATIDFKIEGHHTLRRWARQFLKNGAAALMPDPLISPPSMTIPTTKPEQESGDQPTVESLKKQIDQLQMENAYLKKLQALVQSQASKAPVKKRK